MLAEMMGRQKRSMLINRRLFYPFPDRLNWRAQESGALIFRFHLFCCVHRNQGFLRRL
jgi:hypothetical protein